jgi:hypothetical protein
MALTGELPCWPELVVVTELIAAQVLAGLACHAGWW